MNEKIKLRIMLGIPLLFLIAYTLYSFYLILTISDNINFLNYLSITIFIVSIVLKLDIKQIYWYISRIIIPIIVIYIIYFYLNSYILDYLSYYNIIK